MNTAMVKQNILTDEELYLFIKLQDEIKYIKENLSIVEEELQEVEKNLICKIDSGASLATDHFVVGVRETARRYPAWKEHFIAYAGKDAADRVLDSTEPKLYRNAIIKFA